ncbi:RDD family protein [Yoonia sp. R2331]|uniref:RDD family protein n=1 Tax=Yoonia sp. R2331 TaxID=3237238 RepID=UPI0034E53E92
MTLPNPETAPAFYQGVPFKRLLAWVVDVVLIALLCLLVLPFTAFTGIFFFPFLMLFVGFFYRWFTIAGGSATWGMRLMAIELRDIEGMRLTSGTAFLHTVGYTISVVTAPLQLISMGAMVLTPRGQGLSDLVLGTTAINKPAR